MLHCKQPLCSISHATKKRLRRLPMARKSCRKAQCAPFTNLHEVNLGEREAGEAKFTCQVGTANNLDKFWYVKHYFSAWKKSSHPTVTHSTAVLLGVIRAFLKSVLIDSFPQKSIEVTFPTHKSWYKEVFACGFCLQWADRQESCSLLYRN